MSYIAITIIFLSIFVVYFFYGPDINHGELYIGGGDSPTSEIGAYPGVESDMETNPPRDCHSPVSSVDEMERAVAGKTVIVIVKLLES